MDRRELQREITQEILKELKEYVNPVLLSKQIGVSYQTVWNWSVGKNLPSAQNMVDLNNLLREYQKRSKRN